MREHIQQFKARCELLLFRLQILQLGLLLEDKFELEHLLRVVEKGFINFARVDYLLDLDVLGRNVILLLKRIDLPLIHYFIIIIINEKQ